MWAKGECGGRRPGSSPGLRKKGYRIRREGSWKGRWGRYLGLRRREDTEEDRGEITPVLGVSRGSTAWSDKFGEPLDRAGGQEENVGREGRPQSP